MKKLLTVCTMLAALTMIAFAGQTKDGKQLETPSYAKYFEYMDELLPRFEAGEVLTDEEKDAVVDYLRAYEVGGGRDESSPLDAQGGPDGFGYKWVDDQGGDTATYAWEEVGSVADGGTLLATLQAADGSLQAIVPSFAFPFYGVNRATLYVGVDGTIMMSSTTDYTAACPGYDSGLPSTGGILVLQDDFDTRRGGTGVGGSVPDSGSIWWKDFGDHITIQWDSIGIFGSGAATAYKYAYTFQALLYPNGKIKMQYKSLYRNPSATVYPSARVGIQQTNTLASFLLNYKCNASADITQEALGGHAVWFYIAPIPGRCCYLDPAGTGVGICGDGYLNDECTALGGQWGGPNTTCTANPCPIGRCCYIEEGAGRCVDNMQIECTFLGGQWTSGVSCDVTPCPVGRCCYLDASHHGACADLMQIECTALGGAWTSTTTCTATPCPIGRCCYNGGTSCADVQQNECTYLGGTWTSGQNCASFPCPLDLNGGETCSQATLIAIGTTYAGSTVGNLDDDPAGANGVMYCTLGSADGYEGNSAGDEWYQVIGNGHQLQVSLCFPTGFDSQVLVVCQECTAPTCVAGNDDAGGVCPAASGGSVRSVATWCSQVGAVYNICVDGYSSNTGAFNILVSDLGACTTSPAACLATGRCCYREVTGAIGCAITTSLECESVFHGQWSSGLTCDTPCPLGSCCYTIAPDLCNTHCQEGLLSSECAALSGSWHEGGLCDTPDACPLSACAECQCAANTHCTMAAPGQYPILDLLCVDVPINVGVEYHITDVNVCLDITHTFDGDLTIQLISPLGTIIDLSVQNGGTGENFTCTTFDDEALTAITAGTPPYTGSFIPEVALSGVDGENALGTWILRVCDCCNIDQGSVNWACLTFEYDYILPVEFGTFDAVAGNNMITLNWNTASESNMSHFEVLRGADKIAEVACTNSSTNHNYSFVDNNVTNGVAYSYTLIGVDLDGSRGELSTLSASPNPNGAVVTEYALHQNFPNPFNPETNIAFDLVEAGHVNVAVFNIMGQKVAELVNGNMNAGRHIVSFNASNMPSGLYLYKMEANGFSDQKKMVLIK